MADEIIRDAKLFEAAAYPDRGIAFSEADLDAIVKGFNDETASGLVVPIRVQHGRSPWDGKFGKVVKVWRVGKDLMGQISWPKAVWDFLCSMGTKSLSVGFDWRQRRLREVSVVDMPRVLTARAFSDNIPSNDSDTISLDFNTDERRSIFMDAKDVELLVAQAEEKGKAAGRAEAEAQFRDRESGYTDKIAEMERTDAKKSASARLAIWKSEGKLVPACEKFAEALLIDGKSEVSYADGGHQSVSDAFIQFMTNLPQIVKVSGGKLDNEDDKQKYTESEKAVFSALDVSEEEIAAL